MRQFLFKHVGNYPVCGRMRSLGPTRFMFICAQIRHTYSYLHVVVVKLRTNMEPLFTDLKAPYKVENIADEVNEGPERALSKSHVVNDLVHWEAVERNISAIRIGIPCRDESHGPYLNKDDYFGRVKKQNLVWSALYWQGYVKEYIICF